MSISQSETRRKLAVLGASGAVGKALVPLLEQRGFDVIPFGRNQVRLADCFPDLTCFQNDDLPVQLVRERVTAILDLAVLNNNVSAEDDAFMAFNFDRPVALVQVARASDVPTVILLSSTHALTPGKSAYARSKARLREWVLEQDDALAHVVTLPKIITASPSSALSSVWKQLGALKPVVSIANVADLIAAAIEAGPAGPREIRPAPSLPVSYRFLSRAVDLLVGLLVLVTMGWLIALLIVAVRFDSPGPGIFAQVRVGRFERPFTVYKLRTMTVGTAYAGTHEIGAAAVTRLGRALRKYKIDELPQAWNLVRGDLALVGPRPCLPTQTELVELRRQYGIFDAKPGITGLAQVNDIDMSDPKRLARWDSDYLAQQGLVLDWQILLMTFIGKGRGDRVAV
jgi:lipopolysaccharide/colanic/teichoic acid biosynthesis glycosyltransferase